MGIAVILRMTVFSRLSAYINNALMNANLFALGLVFFIFGLFNLIFVGFFKTAYKFAKRLLSYIIISFLTFVSYKKSINRFEEIDL
ncbi:MAG: hypothetical protein MJ090_01225 [Clostridia bacterium]|nr:hypothetical protein [Clostridia bacterium]